MGAAAGLPARPPHQRRRTARSAALGSGAWAAWRLARRHHWSAELAARRDVHQRYWEQLAQRRGEVLYVAIGDATAQGIGAREPSGSYVGQLERRLDVPLQVVNLSVSGARLADVITSLLPRLARLDVTNALVTFAAGAGDIDGFAPDRFGRELATILDALPRHALVADLPSSPTWPHQARVRAANAILHTLADERDLTVVPLFAATRRMGLAAILTHHAQDLRHPNDRGYRVWARTFLGPAAARVAEITSAGTPQPATARS